MTLYSPCWSLVTKLATFIISASKHGGQLLTTVNEDNHDKTNVPDEFIFRSVSLVCFTAELDE